MPPVRTRRVLTPAGADAVIRAAEGSALDKGHRVVIAVVDPWGELLQLRQTPEAQIASARVAVDKARTAAIFVRVILSWVQVQLPLGADPRTLADKPHEPFLNLAYPSQPSPLGVCPVDFDFEELLRRRRRRIDEHIAGIHGGSPDLAEALAGQALLHHDIERRADPDNWPVAGPAADDDPQLPEAELSTRGDLIVGPLHRTLAAAAQTLASQQAEAERHFAETRQRMAAVEADRAALDLEQDTWNAERERQLQQIDQQKLALEHEQAEFAARRQCVACPATRNTQHDSPD